MIHEGKKLPDDAVERVSHVITLVSDDQDVLALYLFGGCNSGDTILNFFR